MEMLIKRNPTITRFLLLLVIFSTLYMAGLQTWRD